MNLNLTPTERIPSNTLNHVLSGITRLRPLPANVARLLRTLESPGSDTNIIAGLIATDQALTAYILRVANSVSLGFGMTCSTVKEAVMRLGLLRIRLLVLSTAAASPLDKRLNGCRLGNEELWSHSVCAANVAHWLARALSYPDPEEAYVAGLLHDMGKLALDQFIEADYQQMAAMMGQQNLCLWQVEEQLFGIDHAAVGGLMADQWQFPPALGEAIRYHHTPARASPQGLLAALVNVANALSVGENAAQTSPCGHPCHPDSLQILRLDEPALEELRGRMAVQLKNYQARQPLGQNQVRYP